MYKKTIVIEKNQRKNKIKQRKKQRKILAKQKRTRKSGFLRVFLSYFSYCIRI